ncbi:unnamed protein product [Paramecium sonneborni]|uniref:Protein kinase domain-containing protein n=1 Tax=Paramecium sonneborni TaxID=65129 RepID=A0A8S1QXQ6_9CILI|nr:unnamed protein product [Paramecium sonneborni]
MKRLSSQNKPTRSQQVISNGIYFGQFQNPQPLLTATSITQLRTTQDLRIRNYIPKKRLQSPKILSPRQQNIKPMKSFFQVKPSPKASFKPPTIIVTQPTNRSTVIRIRSPIKRNQQAIISQEMDNKSIEFLQELANSQLNRTSRKKRRPQTAGGFTIPTQHFSNNIENYLIQEQIGQGSYGIVKVGLNLLNGQQVAIKIYERMKIIQKKEYIRKEIQILSSLQHPNIVQLLDVIYTDVYLLIFRRKCNQLWNMPVHYHQDNILSNNQINQFLRMRQRTFFFKLSKLLTIVILKILSIVTQNQKIFQQEITKLN